MKIKIARGNVQFPLRAAWRKRLATTLRRFHAKRNRWPDWQIIAAAHSGMEAAIRAGQRPPVEH